jgi:Uma2 family endonuclease
MIEPVAPPHAYRVNFDDWLQTPDDGRRYEILGGEFFVSPPPNLLHQRISKNLFLKLSQHLEATAAGEAFYAPVGVKLSEENVVEPDLVVVLEENRHRIGTQAIEGPPDLVVEILSPGTAGRDLGPKRALFERGGVPEYWIVDPEAATVEVLGLAGGAYRRIGLFGHGEHLRSRRLVGLEIAVEAVFPE